MCYFPIRIKNKRFVPTKKNGYEPPVCTDERLRYIEVECGYCFECRKKKRNAWRVRNFELLREKPLKAEKEEEKKPKLKRGRPKKGETREPIKPTILNQQQIS